MTGRPGGSPGGRQPARQERNCRNQRTTRCRARVNRMRGGPMIQRALAASLGIEGPTLTRHLDRLEELGLIRRNRTGADRRYARVELTAAGQTLCHDLDAIARTANDQLLTGFTDTEITQLKSMLQRLITNASEQ